MKRAAELVPLSQEHHEALVLARHAATGSDPAATRDRVLRHWTDQIARHLEIEEQVLFPLLASAGGEDAVGLARREHANLRELAGRLAAGDLAALPEWGEAMRVHVRFEERELFPLAERSLDLAPLRNGLTQRAERPTP